MLFSLFKRFSFRTKLMGILVVASLAFALLIVAGAKLEERADSQLTLISDQYIPLMAIGPQLTGCFDELVRGFRDVTLTRDATLLFPLEETKENCKTQITNAQKIINPKTIKSLHSAIDAYYIDTLAVTNRILLGEVSDALVDAIGVTQIKQRRASSLITQAIMLDQQMLKKAFATATKAQTTVRRIRIIISTSCIFLVLLMSTWLSKALLNAIQQLGEGFQRFGEGDFDTPILLTSQDEFADLADQANTMAKNLKVAYQALRDKATELEEISTYKTKFLSNVSHELRTPLNAIIGFSDLLDQGYAEKLQPKQQEYLNHVLKSSKHLLRLISDLLDLQKIEAGKMNILPEPLNIAPLLKDVVDSVQPLAGKQNLSLKMALPQVIPIIKADPVRLKQMIYNLLSNAIKFTPAKGEVELKVVVVPDCVQISVRDTGIGLDEIGMKNLFQEFRQATDRGRELGSGLGLALTKKLVELHHGRITVESALGAGSTFTIELPITWRSSVPPPI